MVNVEIANNKATLYNKQQSWHLHILTRKNT